MGGKGSGKRRTKATFEPLAKDRDIWDRQPKESGPAWEAFTVYRDLDIGRTLAAAAAHLHKSVTVVGGWSSRFSWRERVAALEAAKDKAIQDGAMEGLKAMAKRHMAQSRELQNFARGQLRKLETQAAKDPRPIVGAKAVIAALERGAKLDRLVRDQSTENVGGAAALDLSKLSAKQLKELKALQDLAKPDAPS